MAMYIMKGLCVIGILLNVILMIRKNKELRANPEKDPGTGMTGEELWQKGKQPKEPGSNINHRIRSELPGYSGNRFFRSVICFL